MNKKQIIRETEKFVRSAMKNMDASHEWSHTERVRKNALKIARKEKADLFIVELAALLHDVADFKFHGGNDKIGAKVSREWLEKQKLNQEIIQHVCDIVNGVSFKGSGVKSKIKTKEGMVVQDADRLDALGAIGIARVFSFGGASGREIYNPEIKVREHKSFEAYKNAKSTSINHFHEKLLLLKNRMNTPTGKKMASERHRFLKVFLGRFMKEWNGS